MVQPGVTADTYIPTLIAARRIPLGFRSCEAVVRYVGAMESGFESFHNSISSATAHPAADLARQVRREGEGECGWERLGSGSGTRPLLVHR